MLPDAFHTARLTLRPIALNDAGPIFAIYAQDPAVTRFLTWRPHTSRADTDAYIAHCLTGSPGSARTYVLSGDRGGAGSPATSSATRSEVLWTCGWPRRTAWSSATSWRGPTGVKA